MASEVPGSARLVLASGVVHLDEQAAVFAAMLSGWERQQKSRLLAEATIAPRVALLRRFTEFAGSFPWQWNGSWIQMMRNAVFIPRPEVQKHVSDINQINGGK